MTPVPSLAALRRRPYDPVTRRPWHRGARPTRGGWLALVLAVLLYAAGSNVGAGWTVVLSAVLAGAVLRGLVVAFRGVGRITLERELPAHASTRVGVAARLRVRTPSGLVLVVLDGLTRTAGTITGPAGALEGGALLARGAHAGGWVRALVRDRLGLATAVALHDVPGRTLVLPDAPADGAPRLPPGEGDEETGQRRGASIDVIGLREYRPGDAPRSVSWRATARRGTLVVRESARPSRPALRIALEGGAWEVDALDAACERIVALARAASAAGRPVELAVDGALHAWTGAGGDERSRTVLALLPPHAGAQARPLAPPPAWAGETTVVARTAAHGAEGESHRHEEVTA